MAGASDPTGFSALSVAPSQLTALTLDPLGIRRIGEPNRLAATRTVECADSGFTGSDQLDSFSLRDIKGM